LLETPSDPVSRHHICIVGGPDVDARQPLMERLEGEFEVLALGTDPRVAGSFAARGLRYRDYRMSRRANPLLDLRTVWQLVRIFRAERPAIVHTFDTKPGVLARLAARIARVPVVIGTLPGLGSLYAAPSLRARLIRLVYQPLQAVACRWADITVFQNEDDAREFERLHLVPRSRATVIPGSGVRTDVFAAGRHDGAHELRLQLGPAGHVVVVMISRILRSKGVLDFAAAARNAQRTNPALAFVLVGGEDPGSLDALTPAELVELRDSVTWLGARSDVREILEAADVFVFPSVYREGVPRVLLEAASMGLPLVAADVPGSRDVVVDGENGFLVAPGDPAATADAILRLAAEPELRRRFGRRSRERAVARFDFEAVAARTVSMYRELLAAKRLV
jgi:glycosyltransferase involved in cell wall biosynthesis